jgi:hypothetical protein
MTPGTTGTGQTFLIDYTNSPSQWLSLGANSQPNQIQLSANTMASGQTAVGIGGYAFVEYF